MADLDLNNGGDSFIDTVPGGADDTIGGGNGDDFIDVAGGDDVVEAGNGDDTILGGAGDDTLKGENGQDIIIDGQSGDSGDDIEADNGQDVVGINPTDGYSAVIKGGNGTDELVINDPDAVIAYENDDPSEGKGVITNAPGSAISYSIEFEEFETVTLVDLTPVSFDTLCFGAGTMIDTPDGPRAVETLATGDRVLTLEGNAVPVRWLARQTVMPAFGPAERLMPVRIAAGALGDNVPNADLTVTADHGMLVDGVICHAGALINGTTITRVPLAEMGARFTVYHIDTESHAIVRANGAAAETLIDNAGRRAFDNFAEFEAMYGDVPEMAELDYPRAMSARQVPARIRAMLAARRSA